MRLVEGGSIDCPECHSAGSIDRDFCEVCCADLDELPAVADGSGLPPVPSSQLGMAPAPMLHPSIPPRFVDVIEELRAISRLAAEGPELEWERVAAACRRAESLLVLLRRPFLEDVVAAPSAS